MKRKHKKVIDPSNWDSVLSNKCKYCRSKLYIKIFRNKGNKMQIGLYCSRCNRYHNFINEDDVYYYVGCGCKIYNTYGSLYGTKIYKLKNITNIGPVLYKKRIIENLHNSNESHNQ